MFTHPRWPHFTISSAIGFGRGYGRSTLKIKKQIQSFMFCVRVCLKSDYSLKVEQMDLIVISSQFIPKC